jgi:hypothetical protein
MMDMMHGACVSLVPAVIEIDSDVPGLSRNQIHSVGGDEDAVLR